MFRPSARTPLPLRRTLLAAALLAALCGTAPARGAGAAAPRAGGTLAAAGHRLAAAPGDTTGTPSGDAPLWTDPDSPAARQAAEWRREGRDADAALVDRIALRPQAQWLDGPHPGPAVRAGTTAAARAGRTAVLVAYYVPNRDCGQYSTGGAADAAEYRAWVDEFAAAVGDRAAYVIVEPDAVAQVVAGCTRVVASERYALLAHAVQHLGRLPHTRVYLDAGNSGWIPEAWRLVDALRASGVADADGVALNTSNFQTNQASSAYGDWLSKDLGGTHYVIDTSRNGNGPAEGADSWCNPPGRALGTPPTTGTGNALLDAYLWIKRPGESDGTCRGGPAAGRWWPSYALELARNARG
ncbi:glycoside hydrolase family 6 protein [Streptomyces sp. NPDC008150]|uniref:glycoside hydrolase family 6 protein n=1 Tax=Streptomyces sp. NPDC008150 TaxID=3364816 RepID=UPI0036EBDEC1